MTLILQERDKTIRKATKNKRKRLDKKLHKNFKKKKTKNKEFTSLLNNKYSSNLIPL